MEPEGSLPYSQAPATCPYTEPTHIYIYICVCVCVCVCMCVLQYDARCIQRQVGMTLHAARIGRC